MGMSSGVYELNHKCLVTHTKTSTHNLLPQ